MTTKEKLAVMQAYADGKKIQYREAGYTEWLDYKGEPEWRWGPYCYRIKPEEKYRPYKDYHEMVEDFCERFSVNCPAYAMPMIWMKNKQKGNIFLITSFSSSDGCFLKDDFERFTYLDGSPVGKKVEE